MNRRHILKLLASASVISLPTYLLAQDSNPARIRIIYDAFGKPSDLHRGWGWSSLIEYGERQKLCALKQVKCYDI